MRSLGNNSSIIFLTRSIFHGLLSQSQFSTHLISHYKFWQIFTSAYQNTVSQSTLPRKILLCPINWGAYGLKGNKLKWIIGTHDNWKNQNPGGRFGATSYTTLPISAKNSVPMDKWFPINLVPLNKWSLEYSVCPEGQAVGIRKYWDQIGWGPFFQGDQNFGYHWSLGTEFDGDRFSREINLMGIICQGGQEVGDRKSGDKMSSGPNALQPTKRSMSS